MLLLSFVVLVLLPFGGSVFYLFAIAADQYASRVGFTIRSEQFSAAKDFLGGLTASFAGSTSSDSDILDAYVQSQDMVEKVAADLDLQTMFTKPRFDPVFAYHPTGDIEDLVAYWNRMVRVNYDGNTGLIELRVNAFDPADAQAIAQKIVAAATDMINDLSQTAREDATRYAQEELDQSVDRLKSAREAMTEFRSRTRIVDPSADIRGQMGLLNSLQGQLAGAQIDYSLLLQTAQKGDPRIEQVQRRISVIEGLIDREREKFGISDLSGEAKGADGAAGSEAGADSNGIRRDGASYSTLIAEYERLSVDLEYAQQTYVAARKALDLAQAEAQQKSRYLATYMQPSLAQSARYPHRYTISALIGMFLLLGWAISALIVYSLRDRR